MTTCSTSSMILDVSDDAPPFTLKLKAVVESMGLSVADAARRAKIDPPTLYQLISKGTVPRAHLMAKIADGLGKPLEYMADDDIPVEPVPAGPASLIEKNAFRREVVTRYRLEGLRLLQLFEKAEVYNFAGGHEVLTGRSKMSEFGLDLNELNDMVQIAFEISPTPFLVMQDFAGGDYKARKFHDRFPGNDRSPDELSMESLQARHAGLMEHKDGLERFVTRLYFMLAMMSVKPGEPAENTRRIMEAVAAV